MTYLNISDVIGNENNIRQEGNISVDFVVDDINKLRNRLVRQDAFGAKLISIYRCINYGEHRMISDEFPKGRKCERNKTLNDPGYILVWAI